MSNNWKNLSGRPLSSYSWLEAHNRAKLIERTAFIRNILKQKPKRIIDLGCGPGLWMSIFNELADLDCEFIGIDSDIDSIKIAQDVSKNWDRKVSFLNIDVTNDFNQIPKADLFLAFNFFPYIKSPKSLLDTLKSKLIKGGFIQVRQYDGATIRFGPMPERQRLDIELSLHSALSASNHFHHYDLDRIFEMLSSSNFDNIDVKFETFKRISPYPKEFVDYLRNTIEWTLLYTSDESSQVLKNWYDNYLVSSKSPSSYFVEVDLIASLS